MNDYKYASGKRFPDNLEEEKERDAMWLEDRGLERSRQRVYEFNGELTETYYGPSPAARSAPKVTGNGYPTFVVYPDYVEVETVPVGKGKKKEEDIRNAWIGFMAFCGKQDQQDNDCGNKTMNYMMDGLADLGKAGLTTALAHAATGQILYESAIPLLLDMGADPNGVVFVAGSGYTTPLLEAIRGLSVTCYGMDKIEYGIDGRMFFRDTACGRTLDILLEAGGNPFKAVIRPRLLNLYGRSYTSSATYVNTCSAVSVLDMLCKMVTKGSECTGRAGRTCDVQSSRGSYALSAVVDRIAGRDSRFIEFLHCGAFSGGAAVDRIPRYYPGELGTRIYAAGDSMLTAYASMLGLVPRTADIYGPGCYTDVPTPSEVRRFGEVDAEFSGKATALFHAGLPFEWDGRWGMDMSGSQEMGEFCPSLGHRTGSDPEMEWIGDLGSSLRWMSGRSYTSSQWLDRNLLDTAVALGANVDGCRVRATGTGTVDSVCPDDKAFISEVFRECDWDSVAAKGGPYGIAGGRTPVATAFALLDMGADPNTRSGTGRDTALISLAKSFASRYSTCSTRDSMLDALKRLLEHGADVNVTNKDGEDALRVLVRETNSSLWGDMFNEKGRAKQLMEFAQELMEAGLDLNRTFTLDASGGSGKKAVKLVPHEHGLDHVLSHFIAAARKRLNGIDDDIRKERERLEAEASKDSKS